MSITAIMTRLAAIEAGIAGIETAFDESPEAVNDADLPAVVNMLNTGLYEYDASGCRTTHNLNLHLLVAPRGTDAGLPALEAQTQPFVRRFRVTFEQALLLNELAGVELARLRGYRYGEISYGGRAYLGCTFNLQVVELGTTVAASTTPTVRRAGLDAIIERLCAIETDPDT
ncbi:MAG: hypothetical protein KKA73_04885, partial [Chloroflexi bacterium]|nr:hypothetical protein [Chloroflexota bacterium]